MAGYFSEHWFAFVSGDFRAEPLTPSEREVAEYEREMRKAFPGFSLALGTSMQELFMKVLAALGYPLGGFFHVPHGLSNSLVMTEVIVFNSEEARARRWYGEIAGIYEAIA